jgi:hypothetical protein
VLDDVVIGTIPNIDAECEVGLRLHGAAPVRRRRMLPTIGEMRTEEQRNDNRPHRVLSER